MLSVSNAMLDKLDKVKTDFLAIISNILYPPLVSLITRSRKLFSKVESTEQSEYLENLSISADRLHNFAELSTMITSIIKGEVNYEMTPIDINSLINEIIDKIHNKAIQKRVSFKIKTSNKKICVKGNKKLLFSALFSVIDNSVNYTKKGTEIDVIITSLSGMTLIIIKDCGAGFPPEMLEKGAELFKTGDAEHRREGLGLGLYSVKLITELHKGALSLSNRKDIEGGEVTLEFIQEKTC